MMKNLERELQAAGSTEQRGPLKRPAKGGGVLLASQLRSEQLTLKAAQKRVAAGGPG